jgi:hypothetical protein
MRLVKFLIALMLLPACVGATLCGWDLARNVAFGAQRWTTPTVMAFAGGYALWLAVFAVLPKPMRTYVLGHELTHAIWALMMGARVSGLRVRKTGGQVRTSKTNWLITLAPYFFPFYAMLFIAAFFLAHAFWDLSRYINVLFFLIGLGWSFHVTFTLMMLLSVRQPDVKSQGWAFSLVAIYLMNLLTICLMAALLSHSVTFVMLARGFGKDLLASYAWTLDNILRLWQSGSPKP